MDRQFFKKVLTVPVYIALALGIVLFIYLKVNIDSFIPLYNNTQYAYHDELIEDKEPEGDKKDPFNFVKNQKIGVIKVGSGFPIRYDMDYSNVQTSVSYLPDNVPFGETGFVYIFSGNDNGKEIGKETILNIESVWGDKKYRFKEKESFPSEYSVLNYAPDCESAVVIYYHDSATAGFTSDYIALVYEEVK
jgi:hypothetical protein